eukprot:TRINITY_DN3673_c0_g1_i1.p1 TRINITY_DN3673_c0_g1~~TRINITY_DN3673_c0_g1_i1.p1  ORF type:complete len:755 (+),score=218.82 TRINITY_DN3673_c0_g1_i1:75-2339(+)
MNKIIMLSSLVGTAFGGPTTTTATVPTQAFATAEATGTSRYVLEKLSHITVPGSTPSNEGAAEFMTWGKKQQQAYVVNGPEKAVDIYTLTADGVIESTGNKFTSTDTTATPNSVCYNERDDVVGVAFASTGKGWIEFFKATTREHISTQIVDGLTLADHCSFGPSDACAYVAMEGQPYTDTNQATVNPHGGVIQVCATDFNDASTYVKSSSTFESLTTATMEALKAKKGWHNSELSTGGDGKKEMEPEYITYSTVAADNTYEIYVCLQESNMIAVFKGTTASTPIALTAEPIRFMPLGFKDNSFVGNELDLVNDDVIDLKTFKGVKSIYQPDTIVKFTQNGKDYILMANEGDESTYEDINGLSVAANTLTFEDGVVNDPLGVEGDIKVSKSSPGLSNGKYDGIYLYGGRSYLVMDAVTGEVVHESGSQFEKLIEKYAPKFFGINDGAFASGEKRSTKKGPEPESLDVGEVDGVPLMFVGLERVGLIAVYDISDVTAPKFHSFGSSLSESKCDDTSLLVDPEALKFVPAAENPTNHDILISSGSVSNSLTVFKVVKVENPIMDPCASETSAPSTPSPPTPTPPTGTQRAITFAVKAEMELTDLVATIPSMGTSSKTALGSDSGVECVSICESGTNTCFKCDGTPASREASTQAVKVYVITYRGITVFTDAETAERLTATLKPIVEASGGVWQSVVVTVTDGDNDDDFPGSAIAGIVIGSVAFIIIVAVVVYCLCCKPKPEEDEENKNEGPDGEEV